MVNIKNGDMFTFTAHDGTTIYTATVVGDELVVTWGYSINVKYTVVDATLFISEGSWKIITNGRPVATLKQDLEDAEQNYREVMDAAIKRVVDAKNALRIAKGE